MQEAANQTILVIEDNADSRLLLERALKLEGYAVIPTGDGTEALQLLQKGTPVDLILMDLSMPRMGGEEFLAAVRQLPSTDRIKVILVSGWDNLAARAKALGAAGFIRKPVDLDTLFREVERHLRA